MRGPVAGLGLFLAFVVLLPSALAVDFVEVPPVDDAVRSLQKVALPTPTDMGLGGTLERAVRPSASTPQSAGPAPPSEAAAAAGADLLLWLLAAGGAATTAFLGWRHLQQGTLLDNPTRAHILGLLRAHPGLHLRALARGTDLSVAQAAYHLRVMERMGIVRSQRLAGKLCFHEAGAAPEVRRALQEAALQPGDAARRVLAFVADHPGASQSEVARELDMLPGSARHHLQRLTSQGALTETRAGKALTYAPRFNSGPRP